MLSEMENSYQLDQILFPPFIFFSTTIQYLSLIITLFREKNNNPDSISKEFEVNINW